MTWSDKVLRWIEPEDNARVVSATVVAVATYWVAHSHAHWVAERFRRTAASHAARPFRELVDALTHEWPFTEGAAIPLAVLLITWGVGVPLTVGDTAAVSAAAAALVVFELAGGLRRRVKRSHLLANVAIGLLLGTALFAVEGLLH